MTPEPAILLHGFKLSGHSHRVELLLNLLGLPYQFREVDLRIGQQKQPEFLALNPFGMVPVLQQGDIAISDSAAILVYLAGRYDPARRWLPEEPVIAAKIQLWLSVAQGLLAGSFARARSIRLFGLPYDYETAATAARHLLLVFESELQQRRFLVGETPTLADIACYTYVAHAPEGGISLDHAPAVRAWLARIEALPGFVPMPRVG